MRAWQRQMEDMEAVSGTRYTNANPPNLYAENHTKEVQPIGQILGPDGKKFKDVYKAEARPRQKLGYV